MKKKILCMAAAMMAVSAFSATPAFAADGDYQTKVTYDNQDIATEGNPDTATWGIAVPSTIKFTDDKKVADVSVELVGTNGYTIKDLATATAVSGTVTNDDPFLATVNVKSTNNYKLIMDAKNQVDYKLNYGSDITENTGGGAVKIADLGIIGTGDAAKGDKKDGQAKLTGTPKKIGEHKDTLTFSVSSNLTVKNPTK